MHILSTKTFAIAVSGMIALGSLFGSLAQAVETGFSDHDPNDPIQFSADRLEIKREGRVATFTGNVEAVQGDMTLLAREVRVYYQDADGNDSAGLGGSVARIDTRGNVRLSSRGDQARGDWAVYDVERRLVTVGGNVTFQQGENTISGNRLELDLESGQGRFRGRPDTGGGGETRVRGEFVPADLSNTNE